MYIGHLLKTVFALDLAISKLFCAKLSTNRSFCFASSSLVLVKMPCSVSLVRLICLPSTYSCLLPMSLSSERSFSFYMTLYNRFRYFGLGFKVMCVCVCGKLGWLSHCRESNPLKVFKKDGSLLLIFKIIN